MTIVSDELCGLLAEDFLRPRASAKGDKIYFQNNPAEDQVTFALNRSGFLIVADDGSQLGPFELVVDAGAMPSYAEHSLAIAAKEKQALLDAIIRYAGDAGNVPVTRRSFSAPENMLNLMRLMVRFGYAEASGSRFRWTEQIGPSMEATCFWDKAGRSVDDGPLWQD
jgi:hypothetical protein